MSAKAFYSEHDKYAAQCYGNAIDPFVAAQFIGAYLDLSSPPSPSSPAPAEKERAS